MGDAVGIDIGGTNVRIATVARDGAVTDSARAPTPFGDVEALVATVVDLVRQRDDLPVGVGVAGGIGSDGVLCGAPNLGIDGARIGDLFDDALDRPVTVVNDADAATWAEARLGAGRGVDDLVVLTLGTGVGGGVVIGGRLLRGSSGLAGELGHIIVEEGGAACPCGNNGCLEAYASGTAMGDEGRSASELADAAGAGDRAAADRLAEVGTWLGVGIASIVNVLDPALVVIGGGAGEAVFDHIAPAARRALAERVFGRDHRAPPRVVPAELGDRAGTIGAALLALDACNGESSS